jgi:hypothetical protein
VRTLPDDSAHRARALANVAGCYESRFRDTGADLDRINAMTYWKRAAADENSPAWDRFRPARGWAMFAVETGDYGAATTAFTQALELLALTAWPGLTMHEQLSYLGAVGVPGLASDAAACAIATSQPALALQLLELGRGVLLGHTLNLSTDLSQLTDQHLASDLDEIRRRLNGPGGPNTGSRRELYRRWDELVRRVRQISGFEDFLGLPPLSTLLAAAAEGPVVVVNVSRIRCDAIIVTSQTVTSCELPELSLNAAMHRLDRYLGDLDTLPGAVAGHVAAAHRIGTGIRSIQVRRARKALLAQRRAERAIDQTLEWLWRVIAKPALDTLGLTTMPDAGDRWPRLWWCPTGPLTLLPLHAAGLDGTHPVGVIDRVVPSYTPTLRALAHARNDLPESASGSRMLVVVRSAPTGQRPLDASAKERDTLAKAFPGAAHTVLKDKEATRGAVAKELARHRWAHLSCHGTQDLSDPTQGGLLLEDGLLTFSDLMSCSSGGEYVFLSACKTAVGGLNLADEGITLAAALHYGGFRHVIATLWWVDDDLAAIVAERIYTDLVQFGTFTPDRAALALHGVIRSIRDAGAGRDWVQFAHLGP